MWSSAIGSELRILFDACLIEHLQLPASQAIPKTASVRPARDMLAALRSFDTVGEQLDLLVKELARDDLPVKSYYPYPTIDVRSYLLTGFRLIGC